MSSDAKKMCVGCGKELNETATKIRKTAKFCSIACYRVYSKKFYLKKAKEELEPESNARLVVLGVVLSMIFVLIVGCLYVILRNRDQRIFTYNYNFMISGDELSSQSDEETTKSEDEFINTNTVDFKTT